MTDRHEIAASAETIVVKVGTRVLTQSDGFLNHQRIGELAAEFQAIYAAKKKGVLVSSGAVAAGRSLLGLARRPEDVARLQAVAAIGQAKLIEAYNRALEPFGRHAAQILLTASELDDRISYLNARNTILATLEFQCLPVINENDTVAVDELLTTFGDNDRLAALVASLLRANLLIILSDVEGLYDGDPADEKSRVISTVPRIDDAVASLVKDKATGVSKGGMASKLRAATIATKSGAHVIIASGRTPGILSRILAGEEVGTLFLAQDKPISPWKRWIGFSAQARGTLTVDSGAAAAISAKGRSLLAAGITEVSGEFNPGDAVSVCDGAGKEIARGLSNYGADDLRKIRGLKSSQIAEVLGRLPYEEAIHRDNMTVTNE